MIDYFTCLLLVVGGLLVVVVLLIIWNRSLKRLVDQRTQKLNATEKQLEKDRKLFSDMLDVIPDMVWLKDANGIYLLCNQELAKLVNLSKDKIIGGTDYDFFPKEKADFYRENDLQAIKNSSTTINEESADFLYSGYSVWNETSKTPLYDSQGELIGVLGIGRDISIHNEALQKSQEKQEFLNLVVDRSPVPMWISSPNGTALRANKVLCSALNLTAEQIIGKYNLLQDDNFKRPEISEKIDLVLHKKQQVRFDLLWKTELVHDIDFSVELSLYIDISIFPLLNKNGEMTHLVVQWIDITDRKKAEEDIRKFKTISDQAVHGNAIADLEGNLLYINKTFAESHGYETGELLGKNLSIFHTNSQMIHVSRINEGLAKNGYYEPEEVWHVHRNGSEFPMLMSGIVINDEQGKPQFLSANAIDITERKQGEAERERLMLAIDQSAEVIVITDTEGCIEYANPAFEKITGYTREEAIGENPRILKSGKHDKEFYYQMWTTLTRGDIWRGKITNKKKDGALFTEEVVISPVKDASGNITNYVAVKRDVTNEIQLENQLRQSHRIESVGRLAGGVAHDFNNMLGVILGNVGMILDRMNPSQPEFEELKEIKEAAERSAALTRQLLAFARQQTITPKILDLNDTVNGILKMLQRIIGEDIELAWKPKSDIWPIKMDPGQIDQILANLCVNARDAIVDTGKITIETDNVCFNASNCVEYAISKPGDYVVLAVSDDGCGMEKDTLENIFEPFFTTKDLGKGTGLGLSTVYGVVRQNDGCINVHSEPGYGTTFKIFFPRHIGKVEQIEYENKANKNIGGNETILLVEDEPSLLKLNLRMLKVLGYQVLAASAPQQAIKLAEKHNSDIHLLFTDVIMPEMNGRELANSILSLYPNIKCMFMSGYTADVIAHHGVLDSGIHFIQKPFSQEDLAAKLRKALECE